MIKSMTGYGHSILENDLLNIKIEIKSVNSKNLDINFYYPKYLNSEENRWRNLISKLLIRGKISIVINIEKKSLLSSSLDFIEESNFKKNYNYLKKLANEVNDSSDFLNLALKYTIESTDKQIKLNQTDLKEIDKTLELAINKCNHNRELEGKHLLNKFDDYILDIKKSEKKIQEFAPKRIKKLKDKIQTKISQLSKIEEFDNNRFEQEILYYIEKLDIEEETVRLEKHIQFFLEILNDKEGYCGKKLGFILQEMLREINTIGSKANDENIQKEVVLMKEAVEKIKEQLHNIL
ncbi:MAG: YicC family protein [Bacteroidetes bacterium]|nr:YicC family protein [Bacteroidota bacterium]